MFACLPACSKEALFPGKSEIDCLQMILKTLGSPTEESWPGALVGGRTQGCLEPVHESSHQTRATSSMPQHSLQSVYPCQSVPRCPAAGLSKLPNARKFNLGKHPAGNLRQRFPPAGFGFDGRPSLSEQGFHLLCGLLELCPVRGAPVACSHVPVGNRADLYDHAPPISIRSAQPVCPPSPAVQEKRISCEEALHHPWFREHPLPKDSALMPTFPGWYWGVEGPPPASRSASGVWPVQKSSRAPSTLACSHQRHNAAAARGAAARSKQGGSRQPRVMCDEKKDDAPLLVLLETC